LSYVTEWLLVLRLSFEGPRAQQCFRLEIWVLFDRKSGFTSLPMRLCSRISAFFDAALLWHANDQKWHDQPLSLHLKLAKHSFRRHVGQPHWGIGKWEIVLWGMMVSIFFYVINLRTQLFEGTLPFRVFVLRIRLGSLELTDLSRTATKRVAVMSHSQCFPHQQRPFIILKSQKTISILDSSSPWWLGSESLLGRVERPAWICATTCGTKARRWRK